MAPAKRKSGKTKHAKVSPKKTGKASAKSSPKAKASPKTSPKTSPKRTAAQVTPKSSPKKPRAKAVYREPKPEKPKTLNARQKAREKRLALERIEAAKVDYTQMPINESGLDEFELQIFEVLKEWRRVFMRENNLPVYKVATNETLSRCIRHRRNDPDWALANKRHEAMEVKGITKVKVEEGIASKILELLEDKESKELLEESREEEGRVPREIVPLYGGSQ